MNSTLFQDQKFWGYLLMRVTSRYPTVSIRRTARTHPPLHYALEVHPLMTIRCLLWFQCTEGVAHDHPVGARTACIAGMGKNGTDEVTSNVPPVTAAPPPGN